ncbi:MAG: response regulator [Myxococcales bacterium]|nr:response regulator [Myxococcales bacterium]
MTRAMHDQQQLHNMFLVPILDEACERLGSDDVDALLARLDATQEQLRSKDGWVSMAFVEALCADLVVATDDPHMIGRACQRLFSRDYLGVLKPLLRTFGSPMAAFDQMQSSLPRFNKVARLQIVERGEASASIAFFSDGETSRLMCQGRVGQFIAVPQLFDWPAATVEHPECIHDGHERCLYHVKWQPLARPIARLRDPLIGAALASIVVWTLGFGLVESIVVVVAATSVGALWARLGELRSRMDRRLDELHDQDNALKRSAIFNERRYAELLAAKESVDQQVADRTAELEATTSQLSDALAEVRHLDESKTRFFANVSHELRTPLQLILAPLDDLIEQREPPGGKQRALTTMRRSARRLHRLIDQLLDLARVDAGAEHAKRVSASPDDLARHVCATFGTTAQANGITLHADVVGAPSTMLDLHWLESALTNLVANALRHCDTGDEVVVRVRQGEGRLRFEVEDTGPGIPPEDLPRIFDRFAQSQQKEGGSRGTGLGLAIVHEAARLHEGAATVTSELGVGTTFLLDLPWTAGTSIVVQTTTSQQDPEAPTEPGVVIEDVVEHPGPGPHAPLAVIAEDNPDLRALVADTLANRYRVRACANGALALQECQREVPDLVVTDRSMPQMTGLELCQGLRERPSTRDVPVILLTAHSQLDDILAAFDVGADDYLTKPFHPRELLARADVHVQLRLLARETLVRERRASVGTLAAEIAHHVRNPLNVLINGLPVLEHVMGSGTTGPHRLLDQMQKSASRIQVLSNDLLYVADRPNRSRPEVHHMLPGLQTAVRIASTTRPGQTGRITWANLEDGTVHGVAGDLTQVWLHLLDHAIRSAGPDGTVRVGAGSREGQFEVTFEDSGPGVPENLEEQLGLAHLTTEGRPKGTGLGLAVAARIVADHDGHLDVSPSPELGGTRFRVALPLHTEQVLVTAG